MKRIILSYLIVLFFLVLGSCVSKQNKSQSNITSHIQYENVRPVGQKNVLQLAIAPISTVRIGFIMNYRLIYCLRNGLPLDIDGYDTAEWSCLFELTEISASYGGVPIRIPDFTRGDWSKLNGLKFAGI